MHLEEQNWDWKKQVIWTMRAANSEVNWHSLNSHIFVSISGTVLVTFRLQFLDLTFISTACRPLPSNYPSSQLIVVPIPVHIAEVPTSCPLAPIPHPISPLVLQMCTNSRWLLLLIYILFSKSIKVYQLLDTSSTQQNKKSNLSKLIVFDHLLVTLTSSPGPQRSPLCSVHFSYCKWEKYGGTSRPTYCPVALSGGT